MSVPADQSGITVPVAADKPPVADSKGDVEHVEVTHPPPVPGNAHDNVGLAVLEQKSIIPTTGKRIPTSKLEYWTYCIFYFSVNGAGIGSDGGALRQSLTNQAFPDGIVHWAGRDMPLNSMLLDLTGILFAAQLVILLGIGPYADYGDWRPWLMIIFQSISYICQFAMCGIKSADQWQAAQALYVIGSLAQNIVTAFYAAAFPQLVRDLPKMIQSEEDVANGVKTPEAHAELDIRLLVATDPTHLFNLVNITGSALVVTFYAIAVGISAAIGFDTTAKLNYSYRVLLGYFGGITMLTTVPFFIVNKHRPGQKLPDGTKWWLAGPKQVYQAAKRAWYLRQCMLYLVAYFMLQETFGTYFNTTGILQNEVINYSPLKLNALSLMSDLAGGSGTVWILFLQHKFRFSVKKGVFYGGCMTLIPSLWGLIGCYTQKIGFHNAWEFWLASAWNFQTAAWGSYNVTMISEVVPAPKAYMFFALFNTVGKTSGFIGPLISSAIINRAGGNTNYSYWFLFSMGAVGCLVLFFVDTDKAKIDNARFLEEEAAELYSVQTEPTNSKALNEKA